MEEYEIFKDFWYQTHHILKEKFQLSFYSNSTLWLGTELVQHQHNLHQLLTLIQMGMKLQFKSSAPSPRLDFLCYVDFVFCLPGGIGLLVALWGGCAKYSPADHQLTNWAGIQPKSSVVKVPSCLFEYTYCTRVVH